MSGLGHVRAGGQTCPGNASRIRPRSRICLANSRKADRSDMSGLGGGADMFGELMKRRRGRICLAWGTDISGQSLWNLARRPDMSALTGVFGGG
jgi:hypothetical protein